MCKVTLYIDGKSVSEGIAHEEKGKNSINATSFPLKESLALKEKTILHMQLKGTILEKADIELDPNGTGTVDFVVTAAAHSTPEQLTEIVRIAVMTEPDSADYIVQSLAKEHPNRIIDILQSAIGAVPVVGEYVVEALLAVFPNDAEKVITTAVRESSAQRENVKKIIATAQNAGIDKEKLQAYAINGGATTEELSQVLDNN